MSGELVPLPPEGQVLIYQDGGLNLQVRLDGRSAWLSQKLIAELFQVSVPNINQHLKSIYEEGELAPGATIKRYLIVQKEGNRDVSRAVDHFNIDAIVAVGMRVRSPRGTAFRQWAIARITELLSKGFTLDDERIKAGQTLGAQYFDELLARIQDIRSSEQMFYQKIKAIYATSIDYDKDSPISQEFFATVQNKLHWASHGHTAAEVVSMRANANKPNMGLTNWKNAPTGPVRKSDVLIAKNYLNVEEIDALNRIVTMYLDYAEDQARNKKTMHMADWIGKLDGFLKFNERNILKNAGKISHKMAEEYAHKQFAKYDAERVRHDALKPTSDVDHIVAEVKRIGKTPLPPPAKPATPKKRPPKKQ